METTRLIVDLLTGIAWPIVILSVVLVFRREIRSILSSRNTRLKAGPFEFGIEQARVDVEAAAVDRKRSESGLPPGPSTQLLAPEFAEQAKRDPVRAVLDAYAELERVLRLKVERAGLAVDDLARMSGSQLAALAAGEGVITEQAAESVRGVTVLRNLTAHGRVEDIDEAKALDYVSLVDGTLYALRVPGTRPSDRGDK